MSFLSKFLKSKTEDPNTLEKNDHTDSDLTALFPEIAFEEQVPGVSLSTQSAQAVGGTPQLVQQEHQSQTVHGYTKESVFELEQQLLDANNVITVLESEQKKLTEKIESLQTEANSLLEEKESLQVQVENLFSAHESLEEKYEAAESSCTEAQEQLQNIDEEKDYFENKAKIAALFSYIFALLFLIAAIFFVLSFVGFI